MNFRLYCFLRHKSGLLALLSVGAVDKVTNVPAACRHISNFTRVPNKKNERALRPSLQKKEGNISLDFKRYTAFSYLLIPNFSMIALYLSMSLDFR